MEGLRQALEGSERNQYLQRIAVARQAWIDGNIPGVREQLDLCPEHLRGYVELAVMLS
jgi:hypothetical protein